VRRLRVAVRLVLTKRRYRARAQQWKAEVARVDGLKLAADVVEQAIETRRKVWRA
jgi:UDP:flavonoid glycosyltransferase YjiC (YdhE family)